MTPSARVWPEQAPELPPIDGVLAAIEGFADVADVGPLDAELRVSQFLAALGAGDVPPPPGEPDHVELLDGIVELLLHHLDADDGLPKVALDFLWVLDAFDPGWLTWPLRDRLRASRYPNRPAWAGDVGQAEVVGAHVIEHETGDGFDVAVVARHRSAERDHVLAVYVDRTLGSLATDLLVHDDADEYLGLADDEAGMARTEIDPGVAAATIDAAVDRTFDAGVPDAVAAGFSARWALQEHLLAKLPAGGSPLPAPPVATPEEVEAEVDAFLASLDGIRHRADREVLVEAASFVAEELGGDPLRFTAPVTQLVARGWLPLSGQEPEVEERFVDVLRAFVPWAHRRRGWGDRYLAEVRAVLDPEPDAGAGDPALAGGSPTPVRAPGVEVLERAVAEGVDLDDEAALDAFLDRYLDED